MTEEQLANPASILRRSPRKPKPLNRNDTHTPEATLKKLTKLELIDPTSIPPSPSRRRSRAELEADNIEGGEDPKLEDFSESPLKKQRANSNYAAPDKYAHLEKLEDRLRVGLDVVFCGINPGVKSATVGFHFAYPSNRFWRCLHLSGFTTAQLPPSDGPLLPEYFNIGLTDLVDRPTSEERELSEAEKIASVPPFLEKISRFRPRIVCFIGLKMAESVAKRAVRNYAKPKRPKSPTKRSTAGSGAAGGSDARPLKPLPPGGGLLFRMVYDEMKPGPTDPEPIPETLFFAVPSTSGVSTGYNLDNLVAFFAQVKKLADDIKQGVANVDGIPVVRLPLHVLSDTDV
ncbi:uracil DNA N-glycosylase Thp1 [Marasmius sp. AFHP31]|nr:uracil DNA N-glycosylase Thp1 [Marasmius sp. AFHP31]